MSENMDPSIGDISRQEMRTFLRERFLRMMAGLNGQEADITMYEKTQVHGVLRSMDIDVHTVQVSDLHTPMGVLPESMLRLTDIRKITVQDYKPT